MSKFKNTRLKLIKFNHLSSKEHNSKELTNHLKNIEDDMKIIINLIDDNIDLTKKITNKESSH